MQPERLLVWWTSQQDLAFLEGVDLPPYIQKEVTSRSGRQGRGRLWVPQDIQQIAEKEIEADFTVTTPLTSHIAAFCGGIVFSSKDLGHLAQLPGIVTDLHLQKVGW